ncbi:MAG: thiamine-phosphate kinase [Alphaproteobacteria bacterium]|nr:MAG: thiamine-phosphate kinase [Alphaproteobacteria bacterium]
MGETERVGEFDLIARYFVPLAGPAGLGLTDDAACFAPTPGMDLVVTKDMLLEAVHFLPDDPAETIGHKALAVNLSDLAAKGATPRHYWLGLALPANITEDWIAGFCRGLEHLQQASGICLAGGDTTASKSGLVISLTAAGEVPAGRMIPRSGARVGDDIYVTGTLGDGALGLLCRQGKLATNSVLEGRYQCPTPRVAIGQAIRGHASAAADISDGLIADLGHICSASGVGATISLDALPVSDAARHVLDGAPDLWSLVYAGGDDYELVFTAAPELSGRIAALAGDARTGVTRIGRVEAGLGVRLVDPAGKLVHIARKGYQHF